jgi:hypothetical protein
MLLYPATLTELEADPPGPVHVNVYVNTFALDIETDSKPLESLDPDQSPEAEHDEALDEDQIKETELLTSNSESDEDKLTTGRGVGVLPPPLHAEIKRPVNTNKQYLVTVISFP